MLWALLLLALGIIIIVLEALIPSGGALSILAAAAFIGSVIMAFDVSHTLGLVFILVIFICVPIAIIAGIRILPHTPLGKGVILTSAVEKTVSRPTQSVSDENYDRFVNKIGVTVTTLRPGGLAEFGEDRISVVAQGEMIDAGKNVKVILVEGNRVVVDNAE